MSELSDRARAIGDVWKGFFQTATGNPAIWATNWPNGDPVVLDEMVKTLVVWLGRERAPTGFQPGYQLARSLTAPVLITIQANLQAITTGQHNLIPKFANQLQDALSKVHTLVMFSERQDQEGLVADLTAQLAQGISLMGTAQAELAKKKDQIEQLQAQMSGITAAATSAAEEAKQVAAGKEAVVAAVAETGVRQKAIADAETKIAEARDKATTVVASAQAAMADAEKAKETLAALIKATEAQSQIIASILPKGASAGLADAFASRGRKLDWTKRLWMAVFVGSLSALAYAAYTLSAPLPDDNTKFWTELLWRLTRATPLVWLAWVSIVQYGNTIRVQEDYAFKEATSKAFQGYRDHMEHLKNVSVDGSTNALNLLAATTIAILGREPLRIYGNSGKEASPGHSLLDAIVEWTKRGKESLK